jgi:hypothetical protein
MTKLTVAFRNFAQTPKTHSLLLICTFTEKERNIQLIEIHKKVLLVRTRSPSCRSRIVVNSLWDHRRGQRRIHCSRPSNIRMTSTIHSRLFGKSKETEWGQVNTVLQEQRKQLHARSIVRSLYPRTPLQWPTTSARNLFVEDCFRLGNDAALMGRWFKTPRGKAVSSVSRV